MYRTHQRGQSGKHCNVGHQATYVLLNEAGPSLSSTLNNTSDGDVRFAKGSTEIGTGWEWQQYPEAKCECSISSLLSCAE